jgi:hypothetical protein
MHETEVAQNLRGMPWDNNQSGVLMMTDALVLRVLARSSGHVREAELNQPTRPCFAAEACSEIGFENYATSRSVWFARWVRLAIRLRSFLP